MSILNCLNILVDSVRGYSEFEKEVYKYMSAGIETIVNNGEDDAATFENSVQNVAERLSKSVDEIK